MASSPDEPPWVVALLIGELHYMARLNTVSTRIVEHAVSLWRSQPTGLLICEAGPMTALAVSLGVPPESIRTAIPEASGHTTRWAAERILPMAGARGRRLLIVTHRLHGPRAVRMFRKLGMRADLEALEIPFDRDDADWKLRSGLVFRLYNAIAGAYCFARGWV